VELSFRTGTRLDAVVIDDAASLAWAVNLSTVELHPFLARTRALGEPTAVVFDLDPGPPAAHRECAEVALAVRDRLADRGLAAVVKTSGSLGLHVFAPVAGELYVATKALARRLARDLAEERPDLVVDVMRRAERPGRVFIDWSQNDPGKSTVAAWSLRAVAARPTASVPVGWDEVAAAARGAVRWLPIGVHDALERLDEEDLFPPAPAR
jgi:bifunctional non-homologous end joining protein LigD